MNDKIRYKLFCTVKNMLVSNSQLVDTLPEFEQELREVTLRSQEADSRNSTICRTTVIVLTILGLLAAGGGSFLIAASLSFYGGVALSALALIFVLGIVITCVGIHKAKNSLLQNWRETRWEISDLPELMASRDLALEGIINTLNRLQDEEFMGFVGVVIQKKHTDWLPFHAMGHLRNIDTGIRVQNIYRALANSNRINILLSNQQAEIIGSLDTNEGLIAIQRINDLNSLSSNMSSLESSHSERLTSYLQQETERRRNL